MVDIYFTKSVSVKEMEEKTDIKLIKTKYGHGLELGEYGCAILDLKDGQFSAVTNVSQSGDILDILSKNFDVLYVTDEGLENVCRGLQTFEEAARGCME